MRWDDQKLNYASPEGKFPEVLFAQFSLLGLAEKQRAGVFKKAPRYLCIDQAKLDELVASKKLPARTTGVRIDRLCLKFRLACHLTPGGGLYPELGVMHYTSSPLRPRWFPTNPSRYAIVHVSPENDWLKILVLPGEAPPANPSSPVKQNTI